MIKIPTPTENETKNFDNTTISDRLRTGSWSSDSHPTCVIKPVNYITTLQLTTRAVSSKGHTLKKISK